MCVHDPVDDLAVEVSVGHGVTDIFAAGLGRTQGVDGLTGAADTLDVVAHRSSFGKRGGGRRGERWFVPNGGGEKTRKTSYLEYKLDCGVLQYNNQY